MRKTIHTLGLAAFAVMLSRAQSSPALRRFIEVVKDVLRR